MFILASIVPASLGDWLFGPARPEWLLWLAGIAAIAVLVLGADRVVSAAVRLARALGMSPLIVGATIVSLGTTSPEAAVSVSAAFKGNAGLALGNGVGSIICDTALIFGLCCLLTPLPKDRFVLHRHGWLQFASGSLLTVTVLGLWAWHGQIDDIVLGRPFGALYVLLLVGYLYLSMRWARQRPELTPDEAMVVSGGRSLARRVTLNLLGLMIGLALVVYGSEFLVGSVTEICRRRHVPDTVLAATLVALGTSLPELATALASIIKKHPALLVGNILGADILNVLFVIGLSATAVPLKVDRIFLVFLLPMMMLVLILFRLFIFARGTTFRRWYGLPLLMIYAIVVAVLIAGRHGAVP